MGDFPAGLTKRLKLATRELVAAVGGGKVAAAITGLSEGHVSRCQSEDHPDTLSLQHLAQLELTAGRPIIAALLADLTGCRVEVVAHEADAQMLSEGLISFVTEAGEFSAAVGKALSDKRITPREAKEALAELDDVQGCLAKMAGQLGALAEG